MEQAPYISKGEIKVTDEDDEPFTTIEEPFTRIEEPSTANTPQAPTIIEYGKSKNEKKKRSRKNKKDKATKAAPVPEVEEKPLIEFVELPASTTATTATTTATTTAAPIKEADIVIEAPARRQAPVDDDGDWNTA